MAMQCNVPMSSDIVHCGHAIGCIPISKMYLKLVSSFGKVSSDNNRLNCWCHNKPKSSIFWISLYSLQNKKTFQNILDIRYKLGCYWSIHKGWHQAQCRGHCWPSMWWWRRWRWRRRWSWSSRAGTSPPLSHQSKVLYVKVQFQQRQHLWETTGPSQWPSSSSPCMPLGSLMRYSRLRPSARWRWSHLC